MVLTADQWLKIWVKTHMMLGNDFPVFGNWFYIHFIENKGMAFGMEFGGDWGKLAL
ncbi:MAG: signal peptidase II, partial [Flavobacteriales bacterium]|nr:signal peptidase II [Flavobacteriales bacterium]